MIKRILLAIDGSDCSTAAMQTAVRLAARNQAEVVGLFVEDINLVHLAALPNARQVRLLPLDVQPITSVSMDSELRSVAHRLQRELRQTGSAAAVNTDFRVARGRVPLELLAASLDADILMLGRVSRPLSRQVRIGSTALHVAQEAQRPVLFMQASERPAQTVAVVCDESAASERALNVATDLVEHPAQLVVLLQCSERGFRARRQALAAKLAEREIEADYRRLPQINVRALIRAVDELGCELLVLDALQQRLSQADVRRLLGAVHCSLLLAH